MSWLSNRVRPRTIVAWLLTVACGLVLTTLLSQAFPGTLVVGFIPGFLTWALASLAHRAMFGRWLLTVPLSLALAVPVVGAVELGPDRALARAEEVSARVVDHDQQGSQHRYDLQRLDGTPLAEPLTWAGEGGAPGVGVGSEVRVLVDPAGELPLTLARDVDPDQDREMLLTGGLVVAILCVLCWLVPLPRHPFLGAPFDPPASFDL